MAVSKTILIFVYTSCVQYNFLLACKCVLHFFYPIFNVLILSLASYYSTLDVMFTTYISRSFYRLDPRWQILTFFNDLALEGMDYLEHSDGRLSETKVSTTLANESSSWGVTYHMFGHLLIHLVMLYPPKKYQIPCLLRLFSKVGTISVWRPTSNDAIKYMMTGEGVSKSCDVP